ncbi:MAG: RNA polymerase sigma factor, partial [Terriglobales bacterium]
RRSLSCVWLIETQMDALATAFPSHAVKRDASLDREFEQRLADCPKLAYRVALGVLRNTAEAEDAAQEAMLRAYRNFNRLQDREAFRAWLVRAAWRLSLDRIRAAKRRERREQAAAQDYARAKVEDVAASQEFERHVAAALDALPEKQRIVIVLAAIEGYNISEVAKLLKLPEGTVKSRLFQARKRMAERLQWFVKTTSAG